jgi:DNA polymerase (family 10)
VEASDLRGDFHIHTNWSDGQHPLEAVAEAGRTRGYDYLAICDHSQSLKVANGMSETRIKEQMKQIAALNARLGRFQLLRGAEVDILSHGAMDYPNALLKQLDFVVGSVHSNFRQHEATMTNRIIAAIRNPYVTLIAHPTGRLMGQREPYAVNLQAVFEAAADTHTAMEINAYPKRLDLNDTAVRQARERGVRLAISTDTHHLDQLDDISIGLGVARRAWLEPRHVLNCLTYHDLLDWIQQKRSHAA